MTKQYAVVCICSGEVLYNGPSRNETARESEPGTCYCIGRTKAIAKELAIEFAKRCFKTKPLGALCGLDGDGDLSLDPKVAAGVERIRNEGFMGDRGNRHLPWGPDDYMNRSA